jgi:hypothetical protein
MTDLEQQLKETYAERLGTLAATGGDVAAARRDGARMRTRRRLGVGVAAVVVVAAGAAGSLLGTGRLTIRPSHDVGHWQELPAAPLSPRSSAESVWTGREVIVLGGEEEPCPPNVDGCPYPQKDLRDGAAYDLATDRWRSIADAPVPVGPGDRLLAAGGRVILRHWQQHGSRMFVYDPGTDEWFEIPSFFKDLPSAYGDDVWGLDSRPSRKGRLVRYDAARGLWDERTPRDPITPRLTHRRVTATPYGPVVTGDTSLNGSDEMARVTADLYDGTSWRRLPRTRIVGNDWAWAGDRMVDFDSYQHQGMDRMLPDVSLGGTLDPSTGRSAPLPDSAIETPPDPWSPNAIGPERWAACWGLVYDVAAGRAWRLPRPDGAPDDGVTAAWADGRLLAFGGATYGTGGASVTNHAWLYTP